MPVSEEFDARPVRTFLPGPDVHVNEMDERDAPLCFVASRGLFAGL
jgi:hypothetical protein